MKRATEVSPAVRRCSTKRRNDSTFKRAALRDGNGAAPGGVLDANEFASLEWYRVKGSSFLPFREESCIAQIDHSIRDLDRNVGCLVAVATVDGVEVRLLSRSGSVFLVERLAGGGDPQIVRGTGEFSVLGRVKYVSIVPSSSAAAPILGQASGNKN